VRRRRPFWLLGSAALVLVPLVACGWSPSRPFDRESPEVNQAIRALDGGDATVAATTLEEYLSTGPCADSNIGTPELLRKRSNGSFDLGLTLFKIGESFGRRFGEEEDNARQGQQGGPQHGGPPPDNGADDKVKAARGEQVGCAVRILGVITGDPNLPIELRARARYLEGNLNFLDGHYKEAVAAYDKALALAPGENDGGDPVGRDAAWNRAIALKRIDDQKDASQDSSNDSSNDGGGDGGGDSGSEGGADSGGDSGGRDSGGDSGQSPDSESPEGGPPPKEQEPDAAPPPPPRANEDDRMLDQLENAPTVQQEDAKKHAARRKVRGMADK
jgi:hypothetical protein